MVKGHDELEKTKNTQDLKSAMQISYAYMGIGSILYIVCILIFGLVKSSIPDNQNYQKRLNPITSYFITLFRINN